MDYILTNQNKKRSKTGDTISPNIFKAAMEDIFRKLDLEQKGNIDGEWLTNLRFADDVALTSTSV